MHLSAISSIGSGSKKIWAIARQHPGIYLFIYLSIYLLTVYYLSFYVSKESQWQSGGWKDTLIDY
jgi:hypothetical protein